MSNEDSERMFWRSVENLRVDVYAVCVYGQQRGGMHCDRSELLLVSVCCSVIDLQITCVIRPSCCFWE